MADQAQFRVKHALLADDFRFELDGKYTIVGVYSSNIHASAAEMGFRPTLVLFGKIPGPGTFEFQVRLIFPGMAPSKAINAKFIATRSEDHVCLPIRGIPFNLAVEGRVILQMQVVGSNNWRRLTAWEVFHSQPGSEAIS